MIFDTGSVSKRKSELFLTSVLIKMKENEGKTCSNEFIWEYINFIVCLTPLFDLLWLILPGLIDDWQLKFSIFDGWRLLFWPVDWSTDWLIDWLLAR